MDVCDREVNYRVIESSDKRLRMIFETIDGLTPPEQGDRADRLLEELDRLGKISEEVFTGLRAARREVFEADEQQFIEKLGRLDAERRATYIALLCCREGNLEVVIDVCTKEKENLDAGNRAIFDRKWQLLQAEGLALA